MRKKFNQYCFRLINFLPFTLLTMSSQTDKPTERPKELYENPMIEELRSFTEDSLKTPTLDHELDQGETDEDEIHIINDKKLKVR